MERELAPLPRWMRQFAWMTIVLTLVSLLYCAVMSRVLHRSYPYSWPLFPPLDRFGDFTIYQGKFRLFGTARFFQTFFPFTYPAPMAVLYEIFFRVFGRAATGCFLLFAALAFAAPATMFAQALQRRGVVAWQAALFAAVTLVCSWPVWLLLDRANVEVFVWVALAGAVWAYHKGREWTAAGLFGVAASLKLFPFVYLALFLTRRRLPKLVFGAAVFALSTVVGLFLLGPTIAVAYHGISAGLAFFHSTYMLEFRPNETGVDHSWLGFCKEMVHWLAKQDSGPLVNAVARWYLPVMAAAGLLLFFLRIRTLGYLNQLIALTVISISFTPFSGDGTLIHLYPGFALCCFLALEARARGLQVAGLGAVMVCFAYLLAVESFWVLHNHRVEGQTKCLALGVLLLCVLRYPLSLPGSVEERR